eukprot:13694-Heterococcus_DN1.PRE.2
MTPCSTSVCSYQSVCEQYKPRSSIGNAIALMLQPSTHVNSTPPPGYEVIRTSTSQTQCYFGMHTGVEK